MDPQKDVEANVTAINNGLKSRRQVIAEMGGDIEDVFADLAAEETLAQQMGVVLVKPEAKPAANAAGKEPANPAEE